MTVFEKIEAQQKGEENTAVWMVGEQLKDICRSDPHCAEIVAQDLENKDMSIKKAERKIKTWADAHKKNNCAVVPPNVAENIIREFYGLPAGGKTEPAPVVVLFPKRSPEESESLNLADFF